MIATNYSVEIVHVADIRPSPENDDVYGEVKHDEHMVALIDSIRPRGLEEPIIVSADGYIISGHRRFFAIKEIRSETVPIHVYATAAEALQSTTRSHAKRNERLPKEIGL